MTEPERLAPNEAVTKVVEDALNKLMQDSGGGFITAMTVCIEYVDSDGDHCWAKGQMTGQTPSQTLGLLKWHQMMEEWRINSYFDGVDPD